MGVPAAAAGPVTSTSGATRIIVLIGCVTREELLDDECAPTSNQLRICLRQAVCTSCSVATFLMPDSIMKVSSGL